MRIVSIFDGRLYSVRYEDESTNELQRLFELWDDPLYLRDFLKENQDDLPQNKTIKELQDEIIDDAEAIKFNLKEIKDDNTISLSTFFAPLNNQEYRNAELLRQKKRESYLRLYAIKIDNDCFVITGGAIKFHHLMEDREHTIIELGKLDRFRAFLQENGVFDADSFYEFMNEQDENG